MARRGSKIKGATSFRRLLRRLPDSANKQLAVFLGDEVGPALAAYMRVITPLKTGALRAGETFKLAAKSLRLQVGIIGKRLQSRLFYGHILDVGRRAQKKTVTRKKGVSPYVMNVSPFKALRLEGRTMTDFRQNFLPRYRSVMDAILADAARGAGDD
jgi:hypothetical protein